MSALVFAVLLVSAALHASWNAIVKGGSDTLLTTVLVAGSAALVGLLGLPFLPPVAAAAWPYLGLSALSQIGYDNLTRPKSYHLREKV